MKPVAILTFLGCLAAGSAFGHKAVDVNLADDGTISRLPPEYGPAYLHLSSPTPGSAESEIQGLDLKLGASFVHVPYCLTKLFRFRSISSIKASASWYHDESILPYYLELEFWKRGGGDTPSASGTYTLIFNLHTARLMQMLSTESSDSGRSGRNIIVDVPLLCGRDQAATFFSPPIGPK